jgi:hypothetical protein
MRLWWHIVLQAKPPVVNAVISGTGNFAKTNEAGERKFRGPVSNKALETCQQ